MLTLHESSTQLLLLKGRDVSETAAIQSALQFEHQTIMKSNDQVCFLLGILLELPISDLEIGLLRINLQAKATGDDCWEGKKRAEGFATTDPRC